MEFQENIRSKAVMHGVKSKDLEVLSPANGINLAKLAILYSNGIIMGSPEVSEELIEFINKHSVSVLPYLNISQEDSAYIQEYINFYDLILKKNENKELIR